MKRKKKLNAGDQSRILFKRVIEDLANLYNHGGLKLGIVWVPRSIINKMNEGTILGQDSHSIPVRGITITKFGELRIVPLDSDKFHAAEFSLGGSE